MHFPTLLERQRRNAFPFLQVFLVANAGEEDKRCHVEKKGWNNETSQMEFLLLGFGNVLSLQTPLFLLTLMIYSVIVLGNILIVVLVVADRQLHTPTYFFLGNLSSLETCYSSAILPRLLASFLTGNGPISAHGWIAQLYPFGFCATTDCYLLAAMSHDRYLAICRPLLYASLMTCKLQVCGPKAIDHFFWDFTPLLELSCSDTRLAKPVTLLLSFLNVVFPFPFTPASCVCIVAAILRIPSSVGRRKAFSTGSSHLPVVTVFYGTLIVVYVLPRTALLRQLNKVLPFFFFFLRHLHAPGQSPHLQPAEQGGEGGPEENAQESPGLHPELLLPWWHRKKTLLAPLNGKALDTSWLLRSARR
uniref:G-protein coupled receptors family 1 profile domain-containing protein n=1 Tax=Aquila chrysaetos chrysaetos TaxID=223781 RepID=A0A663EJ04_AQUCH